MRPLGGGGAGISGWLGGLRAYEWGRGELDKLVGLALVGWQAGRVGRGARQAGPRLLVEDEAGRLRRQLHQLARRRDRRQRARAHEALLRRRGGGGGCWGGGTARCVWACALAAWSALSSKALPACCAARPPAGGPRAAHQVAAQRARREPHAAGLEGVDAASRRGGRGGGVGVRGGLVGRSCRLLVALPLAPSGARACIWGKPGGRRRRPCPLKCPLTAGRRCGPAGRGRPAPARGPPW
jgi:hypothetical protein